MNFNSEAARLIDLDPEEVKNPDFIFYFSGRKLLPGSEPVSMVYAGHQFGTYVPQLGDGRAILLGEVRNSRGESWDLHLKGSGKTPYSRMGDGRAVLRSTIREYLCSEAMHALSIPTTRALCIVGSNEPVYREVVESAAMMLRLSPSHVRFGSFELFYYRSQYEQIKILADYIIGKHFSHLSGRRDRFIQFLVEVTRSTARLIAKWQAVGFAHGVMNTDNMSILGITIDYGPFGFIDDFDPDFVPNHSDHMGRYSYSNQPDIGAWNVGCLAQTFLSLVPQLAIREAIAEYAPAFAEHYGELMRAKLGLEQSHPEDTSLIGQLLSILYKNQVDYTNFFRRLCDFKLTLDESPGTKNQHLRDMFVDWKDFDQWAINYRNRLMKELSVDAERKARMVLVNPKYILRNYLAQKAINLAVEQKDFSEIDRLLSLLRAPFDEQPEMQHYSVPTPEWGKRLVVSCSS